MDTLEAKIRFKMVDIKGNYIGVLVKKLPDISDKDEARNKFNETKMEIIEGMVRFYMTRDGGLAIVQSPDGKWDGFTKPKGTKRIKPRNMCLVFNDAPDWDEDQKITDEMAKEQNKQEEDKQEE